MCTPVARQASATSIVQMTASERAGPELDGGESTDMHQSTARTSAWKVKEGVEIEIKML